MRRNAVTSNSPTIIQNIRQEFEIMLEFVTSDQAKTATADYIERSIFKMLLALGAKLLTLFFVMRAEQCSREPRQTATGANLPYQRDTHRTYFSVFGKVPLWRPYFYKKDVGGQSPLDAELGLGDDCYSDLVRELIDYLGVYNVYHKSAEILERLLGLKLSSRVIAETIAADGVDVENYYARQSGPPPQAEAEILVVQADGKGVPLVYDEAPSSGPLRLGKGQKRGRKKEAVVTTVYSIDPQPRTPQQVVDSFFQPRQTPSRPKTGRVKPQNKHLRATLAGKDTALDRLAARVAQREGPHIHHRVALCDGCEALQSRLQERLAGFSLILDFIHADEYLWAVANSLLGETHPDRLVWMAAQTLKILSGQTDQVITQFRQMAQSGTCSTPQRTQLTKTANYFERNLPYMDYPTYLKHGWPIASGVIEGACRHFVKDRCELSGMRWQQVGAENLLRLRAVAENGDWDNYHHFRQRQRQLRLYQLPYPAQTPVEFQALGPPPIEQLRPAPTVDQVDPTVSCSSSTRYHQLPLVT
jgi:hypothetical protein